MTANPYFHYSERHPTLASIHDDALEWVNQVLDDRGLPKVNQLNPVHDMAWSMVASITHQEGTWYFKALTPHIAYELEVTNRLSLAFPDLSGKVVAFDTDKRFLLVEDLGTNLFDYKPQSDAFLLWKQALSDYSQLQVQTSKLSRNEFPGLPDRTMEVIPGEALPIIERCVDIQPREGESPITQSDVEWIKKRFNNWSDVVRDINVLPIPNSIHHGDLHGGNIAMKAKPKVFDWGDSSWSHPFVTFYISADACINHFGLHDQDSYNELQESYLSPWLEYGSMDQLKATLEKVNRIAPLVMLLSWAYAVSNKADERSLEWESGLCTWVNEFLKQNRS